MIKENENEKDAKGKKWVLCTRKYDRNIVPMESMRMLCVRLSHSV